MTAKNLAQTLYESVGLNLSVRKPLPQLACDRRETPGYYWVPHGGGLRGVDADADLLRSRNAPHNLPTGRWRFMANDSADVVPPNDVVIEKRSSRMALHSVIHCLPTLLFWKHEHASHADNVQDSSWT